jgi:hypothetical protein
VEHDLVGKPVSTFPDHALPDSKALSALGKAAIVTGPKRDAMELSGKAAFVTGGSGDIGGAIARALAKAGVDVAVSYVGDTQRANASADAVRKMGGKALAVQLDQRDPTSVDASIGKVWPRSGGWTSSSTTPAGTSAFRSRIWTS